MINRGFVVETNFSPCKCSDKDTYSVFPDDVDLDHFQWMTKHEDKIVSFPARDGRCSTCEQEIRFDQHWVVTHQEAEEKIFSVEFKHNDSYLHFKCKEEELEDCVLDYLRENVKDIEWVYEELTKEVSE